MSFSDLFGRIYIIVEVRGCGTCCTARRNCTFYLSEVDEINFKVSRGWCKGPIHCHVAAAFWRWWAWGISWGWAELVNGCFLTRYKAAQTCRFIHEVMHVRVHEFSKCVCHRIRLGSLLARTYTCQWIHKPKCVIRWSSPCTLPWWLGNVHELAMYHMAKILVA